MSAPVPPKPAGATRGHGPTEEHCAWVAKNLGVDARKAVSRAASGAASASANAAGRHAKEASLAGAAHGLAKGNAAVATTAGPHAKGSSPAGAAHELVKGNATATGPHADDSPLARAQRKLAKDKDAENQFKICCATFQGGTMPPHWKEVDLKHLQAMGFKPGEFAPRKSGFRAKLVMKDDGKQVLLVFRQTTMDKRDWAADAAQGFAEDNDYYPRAIKLAAQAKKKFGDKLELAGHSLGGGLAAAAGIATRTRATTFNAAGVTPGTLALPKVKAAAPGVAAEMQDAIHHRRGEAELEKLATSNVGGRALVENYQVGGELLDQVQRNADKLMRILKRVDEAAPGFAGIPSLHGSLKDLQTTIASSMRLDPAGLHNVGKHPMPAAGHTNLLADVDPSDRIDIEPFLDELNDMLDRRDNGNPLQRAQAEADLAYAATQVPMLYRGIVHGKQQHTAEALLPSLRDKVQRDEERVREASGHR